MPQHWVFRAEGAVLHEAAFSRGAQVVRDVMGGYRPDFWTSDRYSAQQGHGLRHQTCLAHLARDIAWALEASDDPVNLGLKLWMNDVFALWHAMDGLAASTVSARRRDLDARIGRMLTTQSDCDVTMGAARQDRQCPRPVADFPGRARPRRANQQRMRARSASCRDQPQSQQRIPVGLGRTCRRCPTHRCGYRTPCRHRTLSGHSAYHHGLKQLRQGVGNYSIAENGIKLCFAMKNKYSKSSKLSEARIRAAVKCFAADLTALQTARICGMNRNTVNRIFRGLRERILAACEAQRPFFGVVEVDESFFGARRVKGKRGRGAYGKTVVFGIFERDGQVYTEIVPDCSKATLQGIVRGRVHPSTARQLRRLARLQRPRRSGIRSLSR